MKPLKAFFTFLLALLLLVTFAGPAFSQTTYVVQPGDTLFSISRRFGISVPAIAAANNIINPNLIYAGQSLTIPGSEPSDGTGGPTVPPPAPAPPPATGGSTYVVRPGDTLFRIAVAHSVTMAALVQVNGLSNPNLIYAGQTLTIPGTSGSPENPDSGPGSPPPAPPPPAPTAAPPPAPAPPSANLLPNPSFENGYYHLNGVPELQVPNGWFLELDTGHPYLRPESRVMPRWLLPTSEQSLFVWDGDWTMKVFKGGARISYRIFTDVFLQPGTYRFTANYFPDLVTGYNGGQKIWASGGAGEVAFIRGGVGGWSTVNVGSRNTMVKTFTVPAAGTVRLGVAFRTTWDLHNNGFFFDNWSLQRISD